MTGAIISHYFWKSEQGNHARFVVNGSFFFIEPDIAITAYVALAEARSYPRRVYAEDYFYFTSEIEHFASQNKDKGGIQCIRLEREWLKEYPNRNITEIHFPQPLSSDFFTVSKKKPENGHYIICEGYDHKDFLKIEDDPSEMNFVFISKREAAKIQLFRQGAFIEDIRTDDCIYAEMLEIEKIDVLYTTCFPNISMIGGPILDYQTHEVLGVLSHETDDAFKAHEGLRGVKLIL